MIIINHDHPEYRRKWKIAGKNKFNGAFYYSKEICKNIIPNVETDRNWITVNIPGHGVDHSIVFIHNNLHPENYDWLSKYKDIVLVCGVPETVEKVSHIGKTIYLPLSIDVGYVEQFRIPPEEMSGAAFVGRPSKRTMDGINLPAGIPFLEGMSRQLLLSAMAHYKQVYAVGRTAIEAKALGCEVLPYDSRFPDPDRWQVIDNLEAAGILQLKLDGIDHPEKVQLEVEVPELAWTKSKLISWAEDHGVEVKSKDTKQIIMDKIEEAQS